jgi:4-hydroxy-3-methylbut-2-enyl diphosphate reductase IspH
MSPALKCAILALSYVSQTTLSVDETRDIIAALKQRFPAISSPKKDDICYATQNRQMQSRCCQTSATSSW